MMHGLGEDVAFPNLLASASMNLHAQDFKLRNRNLLNVVHNCMSSPASSNSVNDGSENGGTLRDSCAEFVIRFRVMGSSWPVSLRNGELLLLKNFAFRFYWGGDDPETLVSLLQLVEWRGFVGFVVVVASTTRKGGFQGHPWHCGNTMKTFKLRNSETPNTRSSMQVLRRLWLLGLGRGDHRGIVP